MANAILTQERLKELLHYNPDTGIFTWLVDSKNNIIKAGMIAGNDSYGYTQITIQSKAYMAHRLAWLYVYGDMPKKQVDHINGNKSDNRISNLREVTNGQNQQNVTKAQRNNVCGYLGVSIANGGRFTSAIAVNGIKYYLGSFKTAIEASKAYQDKKKELHISQ